MCRLQPHNGFTGAITRRKGGREAAKMENRIQSAPSQPDPPLPADSLPNPARFSPTPHSFPPPMLAYLLQQADSANMSRKALAFSLDFQPVRGQTVVDCCLTSIRLYLLLYFMSLRNKYKESHKKILHYVYSDYAQEAILF